MGWCLTIGKVECRYALADFRLFSAFVQISLQNRILRAEFVDLDLRSLNTPNEPLGIVIEANVQNEQGGDPQNPVDMMDGPGVIFAKKPIQANKVV